MVEDAVDSELKTHLLRSLRDFYPIKVDEIVLVSAIQSRSNGAPVDRISIIMRSLLNARWVEESPVKASLGKPQTYRYRITASGIEHLRSLESGETRDLSSHLAEIEMKMVETWNSDIARVKDDLDCSKKEFEESIEEMNKKLTELTKELASVKDYIDAHRERVEEEKIEEELLILRLLSGDERIVYQIILDAGGQILQKDLVARSKMSNSKVSRTIDRLDGRGVLVRERCGASNRLRIVINPPNI
jgi:DNA-binding MarR family transcriptional regulator